VTVAKSENFADRREPNVPIEAFPESAIERSILDRFAYAASRYADRPAISDDARSLTYAELTQLAGMIAAATAAAVAGRPGQVAIALRNETRYGAAMLAALSVGRAFVPLDAAHPAERIRLLANHAETVVMISAGDMARTLRAILPAEMPVIDLDALPARPAAQPVVSARPGDLVSISYTSGSTGQPKGVQRPQRALLHYVYQTSKAMQFGPADRLVLFNSPNTTEGLITTFCGLLNGASLHCLSPADLAPAALAAKLREIGVTVIWAVPRLFRFLVESLPPGERFTTLRVVSLAGDRVDWSDIAWVRRGCAEGVRIRIGFGSTEAGVHTQWFVGDRLRGTSSRLPVGRAPPDQQLTIVDDGGHPVADGDIGEAIVTSRSVALGYWHDPAATARAFTVHPDDPSLRSYRTGDLVLRRPDGLIEYVGRKDQEIKLAGHRIEPGEVEAALIACSGVCDAAIVVRRHDNGTPRSLAAYCELEAGTSMSPRDITQALRHSLPNYMVPALITILSELPRLTNFKIDREALLRRDSLAREDQPSVPPSTPTEAVLAALWAEALQANQINRDDDFFELGGDSLAATTIKIGVQDTLGRDIDFGNLTDNPTLAELAAAIDALTPANSADPPLVSVSRDRPPPASYIQEWVWTHSQDPRNASNFVDTTAYGLVGALDGKALSDAIDLIVRRHEVLRSTFDVVDGRLVQIVHRATSMPIAFFDAAHADDPEVEARQIVTKARSRVADLRQGPLLSFALIRLANDRHWLVQTVNHIVYDNLSRSIFARELEVVYGAALRGAPPPLPDQQSLNYADYATWQRGRLRRDDPRWQTDVTWWQNLLEGMLQVPDLPFTRAAPVSGVDPADGVMRWAMTPQMAQRTLDLARAERTTPYAVRLAAFVVALAAKTGDSDITIGTVVEQRNRRALQNMIGNFVNIVTLKLDVVPQARFCDLVRTVRDRVAQTMARSEVPYGLLIDEFRARGLAWPQFHAIVQSFVPVRLSLSGLEVDVVDRAYAAMPPGFNMTFRERDDDRDCSVAFDAGHYDPAKVREFVAGFVRLLETAVASPDLTVDNLTAAIEA
jgi:amino acid adenylation domain-containing protein